jgi:O-antigen ligase
LKLLLETRTTAREAFFPEENDPFDFVAFTLLLIIGALSPLFYAAGSVASRQVLGGGAMLPRGDVLLEVAAFGMAAAAFLSKARLRSPGPLRIPLLAMLGLVLLGGLQLLPLPEAVLAVLAPLNLQIYQDAGRVLALFHEPAPAARVSIAPTETVATILLACAYLVLFLSAASLLRTRRRRRLFAGIVFASAVVQILVAILLEVPRHSGIAEEDRLHGFFANPNHFGGYLEIVLGLAFAGIWTQVLVGGSRVSAAAEDAERFEKRLLPIAGRGVVWVIVAIGIGATQSRGAIVSAGLATAVLLALGVTHTNVRHPRRAALIAGAALLVGVLFIARTVGSEPLTRFLKLDPRDFGSNTRVLLWKTSLRAWSLFPWLGSGLGTFREAFRRVQPRELTGLVEQAHSDPLQLLVTGGVIGELLGILLLASLFVLLIRAWRRQQHREESALVLGGFGALLSLSLHGLVEFNMSIPAIPALLSCVLGAAWAAGRNH